MAVFKCKMCGGTLDITDGMTVCECEYCGSTQTVPQLDNEKKINLFTRANRLRLACEFDKAFGVYESIVSEFSEEAEAYWGLILCKYGIEYVDDPTTGKKIPTCHRSSFDSVMDDPNFEMVMEYSDAVSRRVYRDEAKQIEELRKGIIEVSAKEEPYDIFICYKETDENGSRTIESVIAQDVYDALTEKGYRVFFSRITLEDKLGQEYEPYIFAALNSAKVMLVFGTDYEYYNAVWVKNEWSRFLALIAKGEKKTLIPCYKNIDAYDMPKEFARLQAQDMGKVGAIQDLLRGINKILPKDEPKQAVKEMDVMRSRSKVAPLLKRVFMYLEDSNWSSADEYAEKVLDQDPENAEAYLGKLMAELRVDRREDLAEQKETFLDSDNYKKVVRFGDEKTQTEINEYIALINERNYSFACALQESGIENDLEKAYRLFNALNDYKDSINRAKICNRTYRAIKAGRERQAQAAHEAQIVADRKRIHDIRERNAPYQGIMVAGANRTFGVNENGTVLSIGWKCYMHDISGWTDIASIVSCSSHTVGLKSNGTVVAVGDNTYGQCNVSEWQNIVAISNNNKNTIGVKSDGSVIVAGDTDLQKETSNWRDIVAISCNYRYVIGLKSDGTVVTAGKENSKRDVSGWTDIIAISAGFSHTVGLRSDGTVVAAGYDFEGECRVNSWRNIVAIEAGYKCTIGLDSDGTVIAVGNNDKGKCETRSWTDIVAISADYHTVGLKSDGTVVAAGNNDDGQCNVTSWKLFRNEDEKETDYTAACRWQESGETNAIIKAIETFKGLRNYKDSVERAKKSQTELLNTEKTSLQTELSNLKGIFSGKRRKQIESRIAEIDYTLRTMK